MNNGLRFLVLLGAIGVAGYAFVGSSAEFPRFPRTLASLATASEPDPEFKVWVATPPQRYHDNGDPAGGGTPFTHLKSLDDRTLKILSVKINNKLINPKGIFCNLDKVETGDECTIWGGNVAKMEVETDHGTSIYKMTGD